jgi:hypothetical protein
MQVINRNCQRAVFIVGVFFNPDGHNLRAR